MSEQVPECKKREFNCLECNEKNKCKKWNAVLEEEKAEALKMAEELPIIINYFGVCGLRQGNIEKWKKKLEEMAFGC